MTEKHTSLEPTFADAIMAIGAATDLPDQTRRHWRSSLARPDGVIAPYAVRLDGQDGRQL